MKATTAALDIAMVIGGFNILFLTYRSKNVLPNA